MDRREFLKKAGLGSAAVASASGLLGGLATPAWADGGTKFRFASVSTAGLVDGVEHRLAMNGAGKVEGSEVSGFGSFAHWDDATAVPKTLLASGKWQPTSLESFDLIGTWETFGAAGILEMRISLHRTFPTPGKFDASLEVVCNIGPAGLSTGEEEGFTLSIDGAAVGPFVPFGVGLTIFVPVD